MQVPRPRGPVPAAAAHQSARHVAAPRPVLLVAQDTRAAGARHQIADAEDVDGRFESVDDEQQQQQRRRRPAGGGRWRRAATSGASGRRSGANERAAGFAAAGRRRGAGKLQAASAAGRGEGVEVAAAAEARAHAPPHPCGTRISHVSRTLRRLVKFLVSILF